MKKALHTAPCFQPIFALMLISMLYACKGKAPAEQVAETALTAETPVQVTRVEQGTLSDYVELNATSGFLQKNIVKANAVGYLEKVNAMIGHYVTKGQVLFTIRTKEAQSIGNTINVLDTTFKFSGINRIRASVPGYVTSLGHQKGDYVQDGEQLAVISDQSSFVFMMQLPYEMRSGLSMGQTIRLTLPGGKILKGSVASFMPSVDTLSQTQGVVIKVNSAELIPENLIARARIARSVKANTQTLPKAAILSNETQTEFWVMKMINATTAVKVAVKKGIESGDRVEIVSPQFSAQDKVLSSGNYGLADTAKVKIVK